MIRFAVIIAMLFATSSDAFALLKKGKQPKVVYSGSTGKGSTVKGP